MSERTLLPKDPLGLAWCSLVLSALLGQPARAQEVRPPFLPASGPVRLYINYSSQPEAQAVLAHEISILDPAAAGVPFVQARAAGCRLLAYVPAVETAPGTPPAALAQARGIPRMAENPDWGTHVLDVTHAAWEEWLLVDQVGPALKQGYDGIFLDTIESVTLGADAAGKLETRRNAVAAALRRIRREHPGCRIVLNRGFAWVQTCAGLLDGVLIESVFQTWSPQRKTYGSVPQEDTQWLLARISEIKALKLAVFVVDYVPRDDAALAQRTAGRIRHLGAVPFLTTPELSGHVFPALPHGSTHR